METLKEGEKGITLIALVVTIIVLLILAGISISAITGDNGIINQAQKAKNDTQRSQWEEQIDVAIIDAESKNRNPSMEDVIEELKNKHVIDNDNQVNEETGTITTNEPVYDIEGKLDDYIPFGPGMIADKNEIYTDTNGDTATIPEGFEILEEASTVNEGLVIQDEQGNQFVWIPVEIPIANTEAEGTTNKSMAIKDENNYRGLLYEFTVDGSTVRSGCTTTTTSHREPDIVTGSGTSIDALYYSYAGFSSLSEMKEGLRSEYNKMMASVEKYHGFYVGRYELGLEGTIPVVKNSSSNTGVTTASASNTNTDTWYGLYKKCKEFEPEGGSKSVVSSMIWGSQYDAMLNWMQKNGVDVTSREDGENTDRNTYGVTGKNEKDNIKNIFDLYGCHYEWTLATSSTSTRTGRGGRSSPSRGGSPSTWGGDNPGPDLPIGNRSHYSTRITLYIAK